MSNLDQDAKQQFEESDLEISEEAQKQLVELAERSGNPLSNIIDDAEWQEIEDEGTLVKKLTKFYKISTSADTQEFRGMIIGYEEPSNIRQGIIQRKKNMFNDNPKEAQKKGHTDERGNPKWSTHDDNMPGDADVGDQIEPMFVRNFYGFVVDDDGEVSMFSMSRFNEDKMVFRDDDEVPVNEPISFSAGVRSETNNFLSLRYTDSTMFSLEEDLDLGNKTDLYEKASPKKVITSSDTVDSTISIDEAREQVEDGERFYSPRIFTNVRVRELSANSNSTTYKVQQKESIEPARLVQIPDYMDESQIAKNATVHVYGVPWMPSEPDEDQELLIRPIDVSGIEGTGPSDAKSLDEGEEESSEDSELEDTPDDTDSNAQEMFSPDSGDEEEESEEESDSEESEEDDAVEGTEKKSEDDEEESGSGLF